MVDVMTKIQILQDFAQPPAYRVGVWVCPECDWDPGHGKHGKWMQTKQIREIIIGTNSMHAKRNSVMVVSECASCFKPSWHHLDLDCVSTHAYLHRWPKRIVDLLNEERERRIAKGKAQWKRAECRGCTHLKKVTFDCYYPYVECRLGFSGGADPTCMTPDSKGRSRRKAKPKRRKKVSR